MAKIWGQDGGGWTQIDAVVQGVGGEAFAFAAGYAALFTGNITSFKVWSGSGGTSSTVHVVLYTPGSPSTGGAALVGVSDVVTAPNNDTLLTIPCTTPIPVVNGQIYCGFEQPSTGTCESAVNSGSSAFVVSQYTSAHFPFASPPNPTPNPRDSGTGQEFLLWADGSSSGPTNNVVVGQPGIWSWSGGSAQFSASASTVVPGGTGSWFWQGFPATVLKNGTPIGPPSGAGNYRRRMHRRS